MLEQLFHIIDKLKTTKPASWINYLLHVCLFLMVLILPSAVMKGVIQPTQTGKFLFFVYALIILVVLRTTKFFFDKKADLHINLPDMLFLALLLYIFVNRYFLQDVSAFSLRYYELLGLSILYFIVRNCDSRMYQYLLLTVIISGTIQAIYGNLQLYGYFTSHHQGFKMTGSFFNPGPYAGFLSGVFPIALGMYLFRKTRRNLIENLIFEYVPLLGIVSILLVIPASQSRAAWIAVSGSSLFLISIKFGLFDRVKKIFDSKVKKALTMAFLISILFALLAGIYHYKQDSADGRLLIWKVTVKMIKDRPWTGHGFDRFKAHYMNYQANYFTTNPDVEEGMLADNVYYAFNVPLQFVAENGLLGFLLIMFLLIILFVRVPKNHQNGILWSGLFSILLFSCFSYASEILPIKLCAVLFLAIISKGCFPSVYRSNSRDLKISQRILLGGIGVGIFAISITLHIWIKDLHQSFKGWDEALSIYQVGLYKESVRKFEAVYDFLHEDGDFLMNYGKALSMEGLHEEAIRELQNAQRYLQTTIIQTALGDSKKALGNQEGAEIAYSKAWYMAPNRFYPMYLLAKLYDETEQDEKAYLKASELLNKKIKIESQAIKEMKSEMEQIIQKRNASDQ